MEWWGGGVVGWWSGGVVGGEVRGGGWWSGVGEVE